MENENLNIFVSKLDYTICNQSEKLLQLRNIISDKPYVGIKADFILLDKKQLKYLIKELSERLEVMEKI